MADDEGATTPPGADEAPGAAGADHPPASDAAQQDASSKPDKPDVNKIIEDSLELGKATRMLAYEQNCNIAMMTFLLKRTFETMVMFQEYVCHLNRFLVNSDVIQADWYSEICHNSPCFGDYTLVLEEKPEPILQEALSAPVAETELLGFVREVGDNYFAAGALIATTRALCKNIDARLDDRREIQCEAAEKQPQWFRLLDDAVEHLEALSNWSLNTSGFVETFGLD